MGCLGGAMMDGWFVLVDANMISPMIGGISIWLLVCMDLFQQVWYSRWPLIGGWFGPMDTGVFCIIYGWNEYDFNMFDA